MTTITVFEKLRAATEAACNEQDLPDYLADRIFRILACRGRFSGRIDEINDLAEKVLLYDTYAQTGYMGMGVNNAILEKTLQRLEAL